jgi:hypothetical protein
MLFFVLEFEWREIRMDVSSHIKVEQTAVQFQSRLQIINNIFINCNWVVTRWQYTFTHKQYTEQHK